MQTYKTRGKVDLFPQKGGWHFIRIPLSITRKLQHKADRGLIAITATIGKSSWDTSLLPMGDGTHFIVLNAKVRKKEKIELDDTISVSFILR